MSLTGIEISNKISKVVISTAMGHCGNGMFPLTLFPSYRRFARAVKKSQTTIFTKSSTASKRMGNYVSHDPRTWKYVQKIGDLGLLNAYGLTNNGIAEIAPIIRSSIKRGYKVIPNFYPEFAKGREMAVKETISAMRALYCILGSDFWAIELNYSCPNSKEEIKKNIENALYCTKNIRGAFSSFCIIVKISCVHPYEFAQELVVMAGADIVHAINAVPHSVIFYPPSPLKDVGGGAVSGKPALSEMLKYNRGLRKKISAPIIMGCGITNIDDVEKCVDIGADAVSICSIARLNAKEAIKIIYKYNS